MQTVPHMTDEIKYNVIKAAEENNSDIVITEIGGTIGDIESDPFIEAIRQLKREVGRENIAYIHDNIIALFKSSRRIKDKTYTAQRKNASRAWNLARCDCSEK